MVLHDINLAARFFPSVDCYENGRIRYQGSVEQIMTSDILRDIFQIEAQIIRDPIQDKPLCLSYQLVK